MPVYLATLLLLFFLPLRASPVPHHDARMRHMQHHLKQLRQRASSAYHLKETPVSMLIMRMEERVNELNAMAWRSQRGDSQRLETLVDVRDALRHQLKGDPSLSIQERKEINQRLIQVMDLLARRRARQRARQSKSGKGPPPP